VAGVEGRQETTEGYYDKVTRYSGQDDAGNPVQKTNPNEANYDTTASFIRS